MSPKHTLKSRSYSWRRKLLAGLALGLVSLPLWALAPDIEADRLLLAARKYLSEGDFTRADQALERMSSLQTPMPSDYYFYRGQVAWHERRGEEARSALEEYVQKSGKEGEHYEQALSLLTEIEDAGTATPAAPQDPNAASIEWQRQSSHSDAYVQQLQKLYLKKTPQEALVVHINSLLASSAYQPSRIMTSDSRNGVRYQISLGDKGQLLVQETRYDDSGNANVNLDRREVFGINPYVRFGCDSQRRACWLFDPLDAYREWILFGEDQAVAEDLAKAMTKLILTLQNPK